MKTQIELLNKLPVRILQQIVSSRTRDKQELTADLAYSIEFHGIQVTESVLNSDFLVFKYKGEKVGVIDTRRGKQEFQLPSGVWSTEWGAFMAYLIVQKRAIEAVENSTVTEDELSAIQDEYEDSTDQSLSDDERVFIHLHGTLADDILSQIGRTDCLHLVRTDQGEFKVCDEERDDTPIIWTNVDTRLWGTSVHSWGQLTPNPLEHLTDYVNKLSE